MMEKSITNLRPAEINTSGCSSSPELCKALSCSEKSAAPREHSTQSADTSSKREYEFGGSRTCIVTKNHPIFVLSVDGKPLTPTTECRARKLLRDEKAKKVWSKFNTFGIQMLVTVGSEVPKTVLGIDHGTKFEGRSVVCGSENVINVKVDLPDKEKIVRKLIERRILRMIRRSRLRMRPARFDNRVRKGFIAPSQNVIVDSRLKIDRELCRIYPISFVGLEDVKFNHFKKHYGSDFSTVEIGKSRIKKFYENMGIEVFLYEGWQTKEQRERFGYKKCFDKKSDSFESHCSDSLSLALAVGCRLSIEPCKVIVVDDTYRCVRRKLFDTQIKLGGILEPYSRGTVLGLKKGLLIGSKNGKTGQLCGDDRGRFRYYDVFGKRQTTIELSWVSNQFLTR